MNKSILSLIILFACNSVISMEKNMPNINNFQASNKTGNNSLAQKYVKDLIADIKHNKINMTNIKNINAIMIPENITQDDLYNQIQDAIIKLHLV